MTVGVKQTKLEQPLAFSSNSTQYISPATGITAIGSAITTPVVVGSLSYQVNVPASIVTILSKATKSKVSPSHNSATGAVKIGNGLTVTVIEVVAGQPVISVNSTQNISPSVIPVTAVLAKGIAPVAGSASYQTKVPISIEISIFRSVSSKVLSAQITGAALNKTGKGVYINDAQTLLVQPVKLSVNTAQYCSEPTGTIEVALAIAAPPSKLVPPTYQSMLPASAVISPSTEVKSKASP